MGVHPGVDSSTDGICCGVVRHNGAAHHWLGLDAHRARKNHEDLDDELHVARHDVKGSFDLEGFRADTQ